MKPSQTHAARANRGRRTVHASFSDGELHALDGLASRLGVDRVVLIRRAVDELVKRETR